MAGPGPPMAYPSTVCMFGIIGVTKSDHRTFSTLKYYHQCPTRDCAGRYSNVSKGRPARQVSCLNTLDGDSNTITHKPACCYRGPCPIAKHCKT